MLHFTHLTSLFSYKLKINIGESWVKYFITLHINFYLLKKTNMSIIKFFEFLGRTFIIDRPYIFFLSCSLIKISLYGINWSTRPKKLWTDADQKKVQ